MRNEELLKVLESSDNDDGDEDLSFDNDEITLEDEQNKFPFLIPSEERIAQRLKFDNFEYLEIDGDRCCGCSFIAENRDELVQHSKDNHSQNYYADSGYTCPTCYRKFQSQEKLPFCCFVRCWEGFNTEEELLSHVHQVHEGKRRENELASSKLNPATKFTCLVCQRTFDTEKQLHVHISYKQKREEYICQECGKSCHKPSILRDHWQKEHTNLAPEFACDICGKAFWKLSVLKNHRKIHVPFENVPCSEPGCEMVFRDTFLMKRHCRNVHGDAPWHCRFCPKRLRTKEAMDIHERVHTGEKPFPCREGCDRRFAHATDRVRHERSMHTSEKPHKCAHCKEAYVRRRELVIHLQRHHNGEEN
nr:gastrula zinc finger protein XlCGF17.1-like [Aedes albopictus]